jgi:hypothetical protein
MAKEKEHLQKQSQEKQKKKSAKIYVMSLG